MMQQTHLEGGPNYVNSVALNNNNNNNNGGGHVPSSVSSGSRSGGGSRGEQRDYVNQPISGQAFHHHHHHHHQSSSRGSGLSGVANDPHRQRRTQKRVTHNEKRYHSGGLRINP